MNLPTIIAYGALAIVVIASRFEKHNQWAKLLIGVAASVGALCGFLERWWLFAVACCVSALIAMYQWHRYNSD